MQIGGSDVDTRKSITGLHHKSLLEHQFQLGFKKNKKTVALSSTEAEYMRLVNCKFTAHMDTILIQ